MKKTSDTESPARQNHGPQAGKIEGESAVLTAIAAMPEPYRTTGGRLHTITTASAPVLTPKTWYGMPAYAWDGRVICFLWGADKSRERYMTPGFNDAANLDDGALWPIAFTLKNLTPAEEERIAALVRKAVG